MCVAAASLDGCHTQNIGELVLFCPPMEGDKHDDSGLFIFFLKMVLCWVFKYRLPFCMWIYLLNRFISCFLSPQWKEMRTMNSRLLYVYTYAHTSYVGGSFLCGREANILFGNGMRRAQQTAGRYVYATKTYMETYAPFYTFLREISWRENHSFFWRRSEFCAA